MRRLLFTAPYAYAQWVVDLALALLYLDTTGVRFARSLFTIDDSCMVSRWGSPWLICYCRIRTCYLVSTNLGFLGADYSPHGFPTIPLGAIEKKPPNITSKHWGCHFPKRLSQSTPIFHLHAHASGVPHYLEANPISRRIDIDGIMCIFSTLCFYNGKSCAEQHP